MSAAAARVRIERERTFAAVAREPLWHLISDTERLNREVGLPPVRFDFEPLPGGGSTLRAQVRIVGMTFRYHEEPYRWVRPGSFSVRRVFDNGPFTQLCLGVDLAEDGSGGTRARAFCEVAPRAALADRLARRVAASTAETLLKACGNFADYLMGERASPYPRQAGRPPAQPERLERARERLASDGRALGAALVDRLVRHVAEAPGEDAANLRPFDLADRWGARREDVLRLCLLAVRAGLLELRWRVLCPLCRAPGDGMKHLTQMTAGEAHCPACDIRFGPEFDRSVEVYFSVAPAVRPIPDEASVYCLGGPGNAPHIVAQWPVEEGGECVQHLDLAPGRYALVSPQTGERREVELVAMSSIAAEAGPEPPAATITFCPRANGGGARLRLSGDGDATARDPANTDRLPARGLWRVRNGLRTPAVLRLEASSSAVADVATAAVVTTLQAFRDTFSSEVLAPGVDLAVRQIAILFSDLQGSTALYRARGDAPSYTLVRDHFTFVREVLERHGGGVVKTLGDAVMAAFADPADALRAALEIQRQAPRRAEPLVIKLGLHAGSALAVTANGILDYFGQTVNLAARLGAQSAGGDVVIAALLADDPGVAALLRESIEVGRLRVAPFSAHLRGATLGGSEMALLRLRPCPERDPNQGPGAP